MRNLGPYAEFRSRRPARRHEARDGRPLGLHPDFYPETENTNEVELAGRPLALPLTRTASAVGQRLSRHCYRPS